MKRKGDEGGNKGNEGGVYSGDSVSCIFLNDYP
jgi:hypothetical protein